MDQPGDSTFWGTVVAAVAAIGAGVWKLISLQQRTGYDGPERRKEMKEVRADIALLRSDVSVLQSQLLAVKDDLVAFRHLQERFDERLRRGDRETSRELGAMSEAFQRLEYMIAHERGWTKNSGVRSSTPPNGYMVAPKDDRTPEPER